MKMFGQKKYNSLLKIITFLILYTFVMISTVPAYALTNSSQIDTSYLSPTVNFVSGDIETAFSLLSAEQLDRESLLKDIDVKAPKALKENLQSLVITDKRYLAIINTILEINQGHLFVNWDKPGINDKEKNKFLEQIIELDTTYPGGLKAHQKNAVDLLKKSAKGENPFLGYVPEVPEGEQFEGINDNFIQKQSEGMGLVHKTAFVMVAGGVGDRLGYEGNKIDIPVSVTIMESYLDGYISSISAMQRKSNRLNKTNDQIPFVIMTSSDTHEVTLKALEHKGYSLVEKQGLQIKYLVLTKGDSTIYIVKQGMVPAMMNNNADFVLNENNPYELAVKPHGHGDVHMLLYQSGLVEGWVKSGITHTMFFQDTNAQVMNGVLPSLSVSHSKDFDFNFITVDREAGEAAGAIMSLVKKGESPKIGNVEYNQADPLLKDVVRAKAADIVVESLAIASKKTSETKNEIKNLLEELNDLIGKFKKVVPGEKELSERDFALFSEFTEKLKLIIGSNQSDEEISKQMLEAVIVASKLPESFAEKAADLKEKFIKYGKQRNAIYSSTVNFENMLSAATILFTSGDVPDATGKSPYPGNLNVFIVKNVSYNEKLQKTQGIIGEFVNPKYADNEKITFNKPTRLETMMQDLAFAMDKVGFTNFKDKRLVFSPVKNKLVDAAKKPKSGNYPDAMPTGEADFYQANRKFLAEAGVEINVDVGQEITAQGVPYAAGAMVVLKPNFASTVQEVMNKTEAGSISDKSAMVLDGENISLQNVNLDGALDVIAVDKSEVEMGNINIINEGWSYTHLTDEQLRGYEPGIKVRGYALEKAEQFKIRVKGEGRLILKNISIKGNVEINSDYEGVLEINPNSNQHIILENIIINITKQGDIETAKNHAKEIKPITVKNVDETIEKMQDYLKIMFEVKAVLQAI